MEKDLLMELGVEEIPSAYMPGVLEDLKSLAAKKFSEACLEYAQIRVYSTPRRLTLLVEGLAEMQKDVIIEAKGPRKSAAYDKEGNPSKAGAGFARAQGLKLPDLQIREIDGVEYLFAVKKEKGQSVSAILPDILKEIINGLVFPKSMRWGYYQLRFARPLRWIMALYGENIIDFQVENLRSSRFTYGHRFLSRGALEVKNTAQYFELLKSNYVVLDQEERKEMIWKQVVQVAALAGGHPMENEELLNEVNYLLEFPTAFYGEFSPSYLDVPPEVLTTTMIEHQRYFPVFDREGQLMPGFIGVRNGTDYCLEKVTEGNQRVIKARLEDALFFWKEDNRKKLEELVSGLQNVMHHERLGSLFDKVQRLQKLAEFMGGEAGLSERTKISRAAYLCKADLLSNMVYEFPELQGIMGRYYALNSGEDDEVAQAVFEHYLPRFSGDILPVTPTGMVLSLAEKLDNLVACFAINIKPTGSQDPYALRRQGIGLVNIIIESGLQIDLLKVINHAYQVLEKIKPENSQEKTAAEVFDFILQRMRGVLLEKGISYDVIDAVLMIPGSDLNDIYRRVALLQELKSTSLFDEFMVVFNRSNNLSRKWDKTAVDADALVDDSEKELNKQLLKTERAVKKALSRQDYKQAISSMAGLRPVLDHFFESVMVMVEDERLRAARLGILKSIAGLCGTVADFSKIVV